jgi:putative tryptophan/tyrosine transport system substrate-binding protein
MRRRDVLGLLGGAAVSWPVVAGAQQPMPVVGFLNTASPGPFAHLASAFRQGLRDVGYIEGQNVAIEYRWAEGNYGRVPALAADLVGRSVAVLACTGGDVTLRAARAATSTIPIVFVTGSDPVALGYVASLNRPGGNATGVTQLTTQLGAKRIGLLRELVPSADPIAVLVNPTFPVSVVQDAQEAAASIGVGVVVVNASAESEFEPAFSELIAKHSGALMVGADPFFNSRRDQLVTLAARHRIPAIYEFREFAAAGGLMSYGTNLADAYQQVGNYTGRILKGAKPADLPVVQSTRFEFVINLTTAKALGIEVPPGLSARADEVIE